MSTNDELVNPDHGVTVNLASVDRMMKLIEGRSTIEVTVAHMAVAQVFATCAVAHALRAIAEELRKGRGEQ